MWPVSWRAGSFCLSRDEELVLGGRGWHDCKWIGPTIPQVLWLRLLISFLRVKLPLADRDGLHLLCLRGARRRGGLLSLLPPTGQRGSRSGRPIHHRSTVGQSSGDRGIWCNIRRKHGLDLAPFFVPQRGFGKLVVVLVEHLALAPHQGFRCRAGRCDSSH